MNHSLTGTYDDSELQGGWGLDPLRDLPHWERRPPDIRRPALGFKRILVPLELSERLDGGLALATNMALESGVQLVLLHVVQLNIAGEERGIHRTRLLEDLCRDADEQLKQLAAGLSVGATIEIVVHDGHPAEAILETTRRLAVDGIVLCTYGNARRMRWLHRNTAARVAREAPCAVWLVQPGVENVKSSLIMLDRVIHGRYSNQMERHERRNPLRSILRILFC